MPLFAPTANNKSLDLFWTDKMRAAPDPFSQYAYSLGRRRLRLSEFNDACRYFLLLLFSNATIKKLFCPSSFSSFSGCWGRRRNSRIEVVYHDTQESQSLHMPEKSKSSIGFKSGGKWPRSVVGRDVCVWETLDCAASAAKNDTFPYFSPSVEKRENGGIILIPYRPRELRLRAYVRE